ncbi:MAG: SMP-30/gluconolactonase/LRE family protein [Dermatophilaceae bacterium]
MLAPVAITAMSLVAVGHGAAAADPVDLAPTTIEATLPADNFVEDVAVGRSGEVYTSIVSSPSDQQGLYRLGTDGEVERLLDSNVGALTTDARGQLYAVDYGDTDISDPSTLEADLVMLGRDGEQTVATFPDDAQPNGIDAGVGVVFAADSGDGVVHRVDPRTGAVTTWVEDDRLAPRDGAGVPGLNGLRVFGDNVYVGNSSTRQLWRIPIEHDGSAGEPALVAEDLGADGFDIDTDGTIYYTTHPNNTLLRLDTTGERTVIGDASTGMIGTTSAAFGVRDGERKLFVVGDGGYFAKQLTDEQLESYPETTREDFSDPFIASADIEEHR